LFRFFDHFLAVGVYGMKTDEELVGDILAAPSFGQHPQDFQLVFAQVGLAF